MDEAKHPPGLYVLFFTEMWERFGFYSMLSMFVLYLHNRQQGFGWTEADATKRYSIYLLSLYFGPLLGGWIADRKLGYHNAVLLGAFIFMVGYFVLTIHSIAAIYAALACLVVGNGFFKPSVSTMVGNLFPEESALKDRAYSIFYLGINIGALLAPINAGLMVAYFGYAPAFAVAGIGMIISATILWSFRRYVEAPARVPHPYQTSVSATGQSHISGLPSQHGRTAIESVPDRRRVGALLVIFVIVIVFWLVSPMGLSLFSKVAPERWRGLMMGGWFVATAIGGHLTIMAPSGSSGPIRPFSPHWAACRW
jgi:POT family proton-dependent oligopeptide transporter